MAIEIVVPIIGESITSVVLLTWLREQGDQVRTGDEIAELETDKATMPLEAPVNGEILAILVEEGETVDVGTLLAVIGKPGEKWEPAAAHGQQAAASTAGGEESHPAGSEAGRRSDEPPMASW